MRFPLDESTDAELGHDAAELTTSIFEVAADIERIAEMMNDLIIWPINLSWDDKRERQTWH